MLENITKHKKIKQSIIDRETTRTTGTQSAESSTAKNTEKIWTYKKNEEIEETELDEVMKEVMKHIDQNNNFNSNFDNPQAKNIDKILLPSSWYHKMINQY